MTSVSTPSSASVQEALKRMSLLRDKRLHNESGEGHDCRRRGTDASKEEGSTTIDDRVQHRVQFWSGIQCNDQAQRNLDATNTSCLPDNSSLAPLCREHPSDGTDQSKTGKCSDDGRRLVKNLSGRLALKLQRNFSKVHRWSMRVSQNKFNLYWTRQLLIDVILSKSAALMLLV